MAWQLRCPICSAKSLIVYTRHTKVGTLRGHQCAGCGHRFQSDHRIVGTERAQNVTVSVIDLQKALAAVGITLDLAPLDREP